MTQEISWADRDRALTLRAIADALLNPGQWIETIDHCDRAEPSVMAHEYSKCLERDCESLGLAGLRVRRRGSRTFVLSDPSGKLQRGAADPARRLPELPE